MSCVVATTARRGATDGSANAALGPGTGAPECREQPMPQAHRAGGACGVAGAEDRGDEGLAGLAVTGQRPDERQRTPVIGEPLEDGERLRAVGLVVRHIEVDRDQPDAAPAPTMPGDHGVRTRRAHREQHPRGGRVLEPRDRRLRGHAAAVDRIASQQLVPVQARLRLGG